MSFPRTTATAAAGLLAGATIGAFALTAHADTEAPAPCAQQQMQVTKAEDALTRVTAVFSHQKHHAPVNKAKVTKAAKAKKAQQMRLTHAQSRLDACMAAQPTPTDTPTDDPTEPTEPTESTETTETPTDASTSTGAPVI